MSLKGIYRNLLLTTSFFKVVTLLSSSRGCGADEAQGEPKSHLELMAEMRDYKRRRQSYRAKNVHITKKSYTEVGPRPTMTTHMGAVPQRTLARSHLAEPVAGSH